MIEMVLVKISVRDNKLDFDPVIKLGIRNIWDYNGAVILAPISD